MDRNTFQALYTPFSLGSPYNYSEDALLSRRILNRTPQQNVHLLPCNDAAHLGWLLLPRRRVVIFIEQTVRECTVLMDIRRLSERGAKNLYTFVDRVSRRSLRMSKEQFDWVMENSYEGVKYDDEMRDEGISCEQLIQRQIEILDDYLSHSLGRLSLGEEAPHEVPSDENPTPTVDEDESGRTADTRPSRDETVVSSGDEDEAHEKSDSLKTCDEEYGGSSEEEEFPELSVPEGRDNRPSEGTLPDASDAKCNTTPDAVNNNGHRASDEQSMQSNVEPGILADAQPNSRGCNTRDGIAKSTDKAISAVDSKEKENRQGPMNGAGPSGMTEAPFMLPAMTTSEGMPSNNSQTVGWRKCTFQGCNFTTTAKDKSSARTVLRNHENTHLGIHQRIISVCSGEDGCQRLFSRKDACRRHLADSKCEGVVEEMSGEEFLTRYPDRHGELNSHLKRNH